MDFMEAIAFLLQRKSQVSEFKTSKTWEWESVSLPLYSYIFVPSSLSHIAVYLLFISCSSLPLSLLILIVLYLFRILLISESLEEGERTGSVLGCLYQGFKKVQNKTAAELVLFNEVAGLVCAQLFLGNSSQRGIKILA